MPTTFADLIDGNPIYAARAVADEDGVNLKQYYAKIADLANVAFSGSWNDLTDTPTIPTKTSDLTNDSGFITASQVPAQVNADWNAASGVAQILNKPDLSVYALISSLATVATSGSYLDLSNLPTISNVPPVTSSDDGKVLKASYSGGTGSYSWETAPASQVQADWNETDSSDPSYIQNKPTIPTVDQTYNASSANAQSGTAVAGAIAGVRQVPTSTSADEGKVLKVDANGDPEWGTGAASQVQADWTETDTSDPSYIQNKPTEQALVAGQGITITEANNQVTIGCNVQAPVQDVTYGGSSVVNAQGVAEIPAFTQEQADWNESDTTDPAYIKNKPTIPTVPVQDVTLDGTSVLSNGVAALTSEVEILTYGSTGAWAKFTAAITAGKSIFCRVNPSGNNYRFVALSYYNVSEGTAEFNFHRANPTKNYTTQNDELFVYSLSSSGTWATATKSVGIKSLAGVGLDKTVVNNDSITFFVKPKTNGGIGADSNGVYVEVPVPAVGSTDNGKVLKATYSGSTGSISWEEETEDNVLIFSPGNDAAADAAAITAALNAGKHVELRITDGNYKYDLPLMFWNDTEAFKFAGWVDSYREFMKVLEYSNDAWTWNATLKKTIVPNYGSGDAGKVLTVNSGGTATTWEALATTAEIQAIVV